MQLTINLLIFCVVLFLYVHVYNHIKTSSYLEVYEIENLSKDKFEDLNNFKQPLLLNNYTLLNNINMDYLISNYPTFDINLYNKQNDSVLKIKMDEFTNTLIKYFDRRFKLRYFFHYTDTDQLLKRVSPSQ